VASARGRTDFSFLPVKFAITIGTYRLADFVELNIKRCQTIFGEDTHILLSDDKSPESDAIAKLAARYGCDYLASNRRRSHFSGDMQAFVNAATYAHAADADIALKLSQRLIPVLPAFRECLERVFSNDNVSVASPGRPNRNQIARPQARFYTAFGILTDVLAFRRGSVTGADLIELYRERFTNAKSHGECLIETTWGALLSGPRLKGSHVTVPELTNHVPFQPKIYLRKSQSTTQDYQAVAALEDLHGNYDLREWIAIEKERYFCRPTAV
jgi:hypothetical protein